MLFMSVKIHSEESFSAIGLINEIFFMELLLYVLVSFYRSNNICYSFQKKMDFTNV